MPVSLGTLTIAAMYLGTTAIPSAYLGTTQVFSSATFSPSSLFAASEPGVWYDPSDISTLFQDTAGTTPVTTPGQTVALMLDKSKGLVLGTEQRAAGVPALAGTATAATYNTTTGAGSVTRVDSSNQSFIQWSGLTANSFYRVDISCQTSGVILRTGTQAGASVQTVTAGQSLSVSVLSDSSGRIAITNTTAANTSTFTVSSVRELPGNHATQATAASRPTYGVVPLGGRRNILLATDTMATQTRAVTAAAHTLAFTGTGTVTLTGVSTAGPLVGTGVSNRVSLTFTPTAGNLTLTVSGSVTLAQLELGSTATAYQKVTTAFDVTEAGVQSCAYLSFDGVDDFMLTGTITPGVDKAQIFAGVRKLSDAARGTIVEHSATIASNNGSFHLTAPNAASATFGFESKGTTLTDAIATFAAPTTRVVTGLGDIAGDSTIIRVNGAQQDQDTGDQGTGNFLAYPLYLGRRGGTTLPFSGQIYSLIVRFGANLTTPQITDTETWVAGKTGVTL